MPSLPYSVPSTVENIQRYVDESASEGRHLEFKSAKGFNNNWQDAVNKISKEISGFANAGGGVIIVGISEESSEGKASIAATLAGIENQKHDAEWLESPLLERVTPPVPGLDLKTIPLASGHAIVIHVPQSFSGPHQAFDNRYYARRSFRLDPMVHYEIDDVRSRKDRKKLSFVPIIRPSGIYAIEFVSKNEGSEPIYDIEYSLPIAVRNRSGMKSDNINAKRFGQFDGIIKSLNPGNLLNHWLGFDANIYEIDYLIDGVIINVSYKDKFNFLYEDEYIFSSKDYAGSMNIKSEHEKIARNTEKIEKHLEGIKKEISNLSRKVSGENYA